MKWHPRFVLLNISPISPELKVFFRHHNKFLDPQEEGLPAVTPISSILSQACQAAVLIYHADGLKMWVTIGLTRVCFILSPANNLKLIVNLGCHRHLISICTHVSAIPLLSFSTSMIDFFNFTEQGTTKNPLRAQQSHIQRSIRSTAEHNEKH